MEPVYDTIRVNNRDLPVYIGRVCGNCGSAPSSQHHFVTCEMASMGIDDYGDYDDYYAPKASASQSSDKAPVRIVKNGEIHKVRPEDLHNPSPLRTVSKGAVCSDCGAKESMCECCTDVDNSDEDTPSAAASQVEPRILSSFL